MTREELRAQRREIRMRKRQIGKIGKILGGDGAPPANVAPDFTVDPVVTGTPTEGQVLTTTLGTATGTPAPSYTRQWKRNGSPISGEVGGTYTLVLADVGATITCTVTATNVAGSDSATSNGVGPIVAADPVGREISRPVFAARNIQGVFTGYGENATRIVLGAQVFPKGWWPSGTVACFRALNTTVGGYTAGTLIRTQIDVDSAWEDGSGKIVKFAAEVPPLGVNEKLEVELERGTTHSSPGSTLVWSTVASGKSYLAEMTPDGEDTVTVDVLAEVASGYLRQGPLVLERLTKVDTLPDPMPYSTRLYNPVAISADGEVHGVTAFGNDVQFVGGSTGPWTGTAVVKIGGVEKYNSGSVRHGLHKLLIAPVSSKATKPPRWFPDMKAESASGIMPHFDYDFGMSSDHLPSAQAIKSDANWNVPYNNRNIVQYMPTSGGRSDIGYIPLWVAEWRMSGGDNTFWYDYCEDIAIAGAAIPWMIYDRLTSSAVMLQNTRLNYQFSGNAAIPWTPLPESSADNGGWEPDLSHAPGMFFPLYFATGNPIWLECNALQAAFSMARYWPDDTYARGTSDDFLHGLGLNMYKGAALRSSAWTMRAVHTTWFMLPDAGPASNPTMKELLRQVIVGNIYWLNQQSVGLWTDRHGPYAGFYGQNTYNVDQTFSVFMQEYATGVMMRMYLTGFDGAGTFLTWQFDNFMGKRLTPVDGVWNYHNGVAYQLPERTLPYGTVYINNWADAQALTVAIHEDQGDGWPTAEGGNFGYLTSATMAEAVSVFPGRTELMDQFGLFFGPDKEVPITDFGVRGEYLNFSIMPVGMTRN